jgi:hypothetical protein
MAVKHINVLFIWLWEWRDGRFERKGWDHKPYRLLYQKSFEVITLIQGKDAARQWKQGLKDSFIQGHWMLPYPQNNSFMRKFKRRVARSCGGPAFIEAWICIIRNWTSS